MDTPITAARAGDAAQLDTIKDYFPEAFAVVSALMSAGWVVDAINDGGESEDPAEKMNAEQVADAICAVDEAHLYVRNTASGVRTRLLFVLGNSPGELVADGSGAERHQPAWDVVTKVADAWEGREQPMTTWAARRERSALIAKQATEPRANTNKLASAMAVTGERLQHNFLVVHGPDAEFIQKGIVVAWNCRDDVLSALKQAEEALAKAQGFRFSDSACWYDDGKALEAVRAALAKGGAL